MFNGYEIWKSDSQKCTTYRVGQQAGAMCGRCMKTCPWNLEGLFAEAPFRWLAMNAPGTAKWLAALDDRVGRGGLNPVKKWWWDLGNGRDGGAYTVQENTNARGLQTDLDLKPADQTLAVYPANLVPPPYFLSVSHGSRGRDSEAHEALLSPDEYKRRLAEGDTVNLAHEFRLPEGSATGNQGRGRRSRGDDRRDLEVRIPCARRHPAARVRGRCAPGHRSQSQASSGSIRCPETRQTDRSTRSPCCARTKAAAARSCCTGSSIRAGRFLSRDRSTTSHWPRT